MAFDRPEIIRPPSEARSYFLPLTKGCSNNTCIFCSYYGAKLIVREIEEVKKEIDALALSLKHGVYLPSIPISPLNYWDGKRVFLQDGDALVYPLPKLKEALQYLNGRLPFLERIATYGTPQDILRRSVSQLKILRELKLGIIYVGLESGDDGVLQKVEKGVNSQQVIEAARKAKEAGIILSVTVILGLGGVEGSKKHALATARTLNEIDAEYVGALTLTLIPGTPLFEQEKRGNFSLIPPFQSLEELEIIIENSNFTNCFFSSMHASNYLSVKGRLPQQKERMLRQIDTVLERKDPALLRPEFMRGL